MRRRLVVSIALVAGVAVLLFAIPLAVVLDRAQRDEALLRLQRDTVAATRGIDVTGAAGDAIELPQSFSGLAVYDATGRRLAGTGGPSRADAVVRRALSTRSPTDATTDDTMVVAVPLVVNERVTGAVRAQRTTAQAGSETTSQRGILIATAIAVLALAVVAAIVLGRRLAQPLERLAAAARRLGEGDFAVRSPRAGVPEVDEVALALENTADRLNALVNRERAFTADASHQLRTPLAALRIELESILLCDDPPPEVVAALGQVDRLQSTIDTLLTVARDAPRTQDVLRVGLLLDDVEARWRGPLAQSGRPLRVSVEPAAGAARFSAAVAHEILEILLDNALTHGAGLVKVTARPAGDSIAIDVADEGAAALDPDTIFERRSNEAAGHGVGLALARALAHAEGGRLALTRSSPPLFTLHMPGAPPQRQ